MGKITDLNIVGLDPAKHAARLGDAHEMIVSGILTRLGFEVGLISAKGGPYDLWLIGYEKPGGRIKPLRVQVRIAINNAIRELKPDIIITHWPISTHPDFRETGLATLDACFFALVVSGKWAEKHKSHWTTRMYTFECPELAVDFKPTVLIDVTKSMDMKIKAAKCFKIHIDANLEGDVDKWISTTCTGPCRYWGLKAGVTYAEPFRQVEIHETHLKAMMYLP